MPRFRYIRLFVLLLPLSAAAQRTETGRFLAGRRGLDNAPAAAALTQARQAHLDLFTPAHTARADLARPRINLLSAPWTSIGPNQIATPRYGAVTGRITSIAIDPSDPSGNTVFLGTTGGGVWKSTTAAGSAASVTFTPLTDTLPAFSANSGTAAIPSLSIGALSAAPGVLLAGTGDPNDALDSYYGEGILRSTDGGLTWTLATRSYDGVAGNHSFVGLGVAGFAWSSLTPNLVVAAISQAFEGALNNAPNSTSAVMGLYYSVDAGVTWQMATIQDGSQIVQRPLPTGGNVGGNAATAVVWNALRGRFYAAVRYHGFYESVDGATWTRLAHQPGAGLTLAACPTNPSGIGFATCPIFRGALAVQPVTGDTFALTVDANNLDEGLWQDTCASPVSGAACPTPAIAFATKLTSTPLEASATSTAIPQADYNLTLAAVPVGAGSSADTLLFAGTVDLFRCTLASGCTLRNTTNAQNGCGAPAMVAPAQHAIAGLAGAGTGGAPLLFVGNDGGLWRSVDGVNQQSTPCSADDATHFQNLNGGIGSLAEIVSFAENPTDPNTVLAAVGSNGTAATSSASTSSPWPQLSAGEGGTVAIDSTNPANWYLSTQAGVSLRTCNKGYACTAPDFAGTPTIGYGQVSNDASLIAPPFLLDPGLTSDVLVGTCRVWRGPATDGGSWPGSNAVSTVFSGPQNSACSATTNGFVRSLAAAGPSSGSVAAQNGGSTVLYAGLAGSQDGGGTAAGGHIFATSAGSTASGSTTWTDLARNPVINDTADSGVFNPGGFDISALAPDPHDATGKTLYATVMGFTGNGTNVPHVYGSTDGGAHWTNLSANLPNAPANAVVVDPYDPNTVYVALDTGVYVATSISSCRVTNCWSIYGTALPNAPVVDLQAAPAMPTGDGRLGMLRAATYGRGIWSIPLLNAVVASAPAISVAPGALNFGIQAVSTASSTQTVTISNSGTAPLTLSQINSSGDFAQTTTCSTAPIAAGVSCTVSVTFLPSAVGARTGVLTIYGNAVGGQTAIQLSGTGAPPAAIVLNPVFLSFPSTPVGAASPIQTFTVSNSGGIPGTLGAPVFTGDFSLTASTCGAILAAGATCTLSATFQPTASGTRTGTLNLATSGPPLFATLSGSGIAPAAIAVNPIQLTYADTALRATSATQTITVTNTGGLPATLRTPTLTGDFILSANGCGLSLAGNSSCSLSLAFAPAAAGARSGVLTIPSNTGTGQSTVALSGNGLVPATIVLNPTQLTFASTIVGASSPVQNITVSNTGSAPASLAPPTVSGDFVITANTCGTTLAASTGCTVSVAFKPTASGSRTGTFTASTSAGLQTSALSGTGTLPATDALSPPILIFPQQQLNTASTSQAITLTNSGDLALQLIAASITAGDFAVTNACGNSLNGHASCTLQVTFVPKSLGAQTGVLTLSDQYRTQIISLNGTGVAPPGVSLSPLSTLSFGAIGIGASSSPQTVTLTNNGGLPLAIQRVAATGDFSVPTNTCGVTLAPSSACTLDVVFSPTTGGARTGTLSVADNAANSPQTIALTGTGVDFALNSNGPTSFTIAAGGEAVFPLLLSSASGIPGTVTFTCAPIPPPATRQGLPPPPPPRQPLPRAPRRHQQCHRDGRHLSRRR